MKTLTEFSATTLKTLQTQWDETAQSGKTPEELPAAFGETTKLEGDKLTWAQAALEMVKTARGAVKRILVMSAAEGEKAPAGAVQKGDHWFSIEYFPEAFRKSAPAADRDFGGRDGKRGGKGGRGRDGKGGGRGGERGGERGAPRGDSRGAGGDRRPPQANVPANPRVIDMSTIPLVEIKKQPRAPRGERPARAPRPPREPRAPREPREPAAPMVRPEGYAPSVKTRAQVESERAAMAVAPAQASAAEGASESATQ